MAHPVIVAGVETGGVSRMNSLADGQSRPKRCVTAPAENIPTKKLAFRQKRDHDMCEADGQSWRQEIRCIRL